MTQSQGQIIGDHGEDLFRCLLPEGWIKTKRTPDPHTDFYVECVRHGELTGKKFEAQVRTKHELGSREPCIRVEIATLEYAKRSRVPVFGVCIAADLRAGFYIDLTAAAESLAESSPVWRQKTTSFRIPRENTISDGELLGRALDVAWVHMEERHPGSIEAAARRSAKEIEDRDHRIKVKTLYDGERVSHSIDSRDGSALEFKLHITGKSKQIQEEFDRLLAEGGKLENNGDLQISVSDMPGYLGETLDIQAFETKQADDGALIIELRDSSDHIVGSCNFTVNWVGGTKRRVGKLLIDGTEVYQGECVLETLADGRMRNHYEFTLSLATWEGLTVRRLPGFAQVCAMFERYAQADHIRMTVVLGDSSATVDADVQRDARLDTIARVIELTRMLREIAQARSIDFVWGGDQIVAAEAEIDLMHEVVTTGQAILGSGSVGLRLGSGEMDEAFLNHCASETNPFWLAVPTDETPLLGVCLGLGRLTKEATNCTIVSVEDQADSGTAVQVKVEEWQLVWPGHGG